QRARRTDLASPSRSHSSALAAGLRSFGDDGVKGVGLIRTVGIAEPDSDGAPVWQRDLLDKSVGRSVACGITDDAVALADLEKAALAEPRTTQTVRRRGLKAPGGDFPALVSDVEDEMRMRVHPLDAFQRARPAARRLVDFKLRLQRVMRERDDGQQNDRCPQKRLQLSLRLDRQTRS